MWSDVPPYYVYGLYYGMHEYVLVTLVVFLEKCLSVIRGRMFLSGG